MNSIVNLVFCFTLHQKHEPNRLKKKNFTAVYIDVQQT